MKQQLSERREGAANPFEVTTRRRDGRKVFLRVSPRFCLGEDGAYTGSIIILADITGFRHMERVFRDSERKYRNFFENDLTGNFISTVDGELLDCNQALLDIFGFESVAEAKSVDVESMYADPETRKTMIDKIRVEKKLSHHEQELLKTTGESIWVVQNTVGEFDDSGSLTRIRGHLIDITERKKTQEKLQEYLAKLKDMASRILHAEDGERRRIAVGLHDNICQKLVISKMALESSLQLISDANVSSSLKIVSRSIGEVIADADSLTFSLSSPILYELGIVAAIKEYLHREIRKKHGIAVEFESDAQLGKLDKNTKTLLYRISRELLTNVIKHARASNVKVSVHGSGGRLCIAIQDNGVGFKQDKADSIVAKATRFGLSSVREQLEYIGGHLKLEFEPGHGTTAKVVIPLEE